MSDPSGTIVTPLGAVQRPGTKRGIAQIRDLAVELGAELVLVGLPLTLSGGESDQTRETRAFAQSLARRLPATVGVEMHDERFTTRMAQRMEGEFASDEDSRAAALLLEDWLERRSP